MSRSFLVVTLIYPVDDAAHRFSTRTRLVLTMTIRFGVFVPQGWKMDLVEIKMVAG
jgi:hypothetical protein